jgi:hypothetical protein
MLLPIESAGLAIKDVSPQLKGCIAALADNRPCIVARATYQDYGTNLASVPVIGFTFPENTLQPGRQIRIRLFGTARNASGGAPQAFQPIIRVVQTVGNQVIGAVTTLQASALASAWDLDAVLTVSIPRAQGQYVPQLGQSAAQLSSNVSASGLQPNDAISIGGVMNVTISDSTLTGASNAGGIFDAAAPGAFVLASLDPNNTTLINTIPTKFALELTTGANTSLVVLGGYMEAL